MKYQSVLFASIKLQNIKDSPTLSHTIPRIFKFFFLPLQPRLSSISAFAQKRQEPLMIQNTRWRDFCQQMGREKKKNILGDDWHPCIFLLFLWCSSRHSCQKLWPHTLADAAIWWYASLIPANHLAGRSIINLAVNHSSHSQWWRMSVRGSVADMRWLYMSNFDTSHLAL